MMSCPTDWACAAYLLSLIAAKIPDDEWNLLYVAVTRAMSSLVITKNILRILTVAGVRYDHTAHSLLSLSAHSPHKVAQSVQTSTFTSPFLPVTQRSLCHDGSKLVKVFTKHL